MFLFSIVLQADQFDEGGVRFAFADDFRTFRLGKANLRRFFAVRGGVLRVNIPRLEFVDKRRFPDACLARNEDDRTFPLRRLLKIAADRLQILFASDKCCHRIVEPPISQIEEKIKEKNL